MQSTTQKYFFRREPKVVESAIATNRAFNQRSTHRRCLQAWAAVLRWASIAGSDRVEFKLGDEVALRFFDGNNAIDVTEVSQPTQEIGRQIFWNLVRAFSPFGVLTGLRSTKRILGFGKKLSGSFLVDDKPPSLWQVNIMKDSAVFTLQPTVAKGEQKGRAS